MINTPEFSDKMSDFKQSGVETFQCCFPRNPGNFCMLFNNLAEILFSDIELRTLNVYAKKKE